MEGVFERATERLMALPHGTKDRRGRLWTIPESEGRHFVLTDIHGCWHTFMALLDRLEIKAEDHLYILGDMVNRGPYSFYVLQTVAELLDRGLIVYPLRGNHEQMLLEAHREKKWKKLTALARERNSAHLLTEQGGLNSAVRGFLKHLPYALESPTHYMVHAGFHTEDGHPFSDWKNMLNIREFKYDADLFGNKRILHGHVPTDWAKIQAAWGGDQKRKSNKGEAQPIVGLDNGCVNVGRKGQGALVCVELNGGTWIRQKNIDIIPQ